METVGHHLHSKHEEVPTPPERVALGAAAEASLPVEAFAVVVDHDLEAPTLFAAHQGGPNHVDVR